MKLWSNGVVIFVRVVHRAEKAGVFYLRRLYEICHVQGECGHAARSQSHGKVSQV